MTDLVPGSRDLVGAVQSFGLFSAAAVVDRYIEFVDRALTRDVPAPERDAGVQVAEAWVRLLDTTSALLRSGVPQESAAETLVLPPTGAGRSAEASLWVHNTTPSPAPDVDLQVTGLVSAGGDRIAADAVSLLPAQVELLAAGTSAQVRLQVHVPAGQAAGRYHGLVVSSAAPEPLALRLEVCGP